MGDLQATAPVVGSLAVTSKDLVRFRPGMAKLDLLLKDELFRSWIGRTDGKDRWKLREPKHGHQAWSTEKPCKLWNPWVICLGYPEGHWVMPPQDYSTDW